MFIEYEIREDIETHIGIINCDCLTAIEIKSDVFCATLFNENLVVRIQPKTVYNAFRRALLGESVQMNGIGFVRPLEPLKTPSLAPVKTITWRDVP